MCIHSVRVCQQYSRRNVLVGELGDGIPLLAPVGRALGLGRWGSNDGQEGGAGEVVAADSREDGRMIAFRHGILL